ncbi:organic hydroperoxide resistance protein [Streptomyces sp. 184]|uniref:organic hydroperoxide resistance protein n=1 Tax=Streptomyces sp. 184 TaxID=1827526 RepID=UPI003891674F
MSVLYTAVGTANGRDGRGATSDGKLDVKLAPPPEMGGDGNGTNPEQLFAVGYAACFTSAMGVVAKRMDLDVSDVSTTAEVGIGPNAEGGFALEVTLRVELPDAISAEQGKALLDAAHQVCPYSNATRGNIPVHLVVE